MDSKSGKEGQQTGAILFHGIFLTSSHCQKELEKQRLLIQDIEATYFHIYRSDTMEAKTLLPKITVPTFEPTRAEIEAEKERETALLTEFTPKEERKAA